MDKRRVYSLDVFKMLLAYEIALGHFLIELPPSPGVAVDFFFILSGFFLGKKFYSQTYGKGNDGCSAWEYTLAHTKSIYPHYLFSLAVFFVYLVIRSIVYLFLEPSWQSVWDLGAFFYDQIPELLMLQSSHTFTNGILFPSWQISATLIGGYFVYELLRQNEKLTRRVLLPLSLLMVRYALASGVDNFSNIGYIYMPLLRAFSAMGLGVLTWYFMGTKYCTTLLRHKLAVNIGSILAIAGMLLYTDRGRIFLVLIPFLIVVCWGSDCWLNRIFSHSMFRGCAKMSLAVYMNHSFILSICINQIQPRIGNVDWNTLGVIYIIVLTVYSLITIRIVDWLTAKWSARNA